MLCWMALDLAPYQHVNEESVDGDEESSDADENQAGMNEV